MNIFVRHTRSNSAGNGSDYDGGWIKLTNPISIYFSERGKEFVKSEEGVFARYNAYSSISPYGWEYVLPNHLDKWGMQDD